MTRIGIVGLGFMGRTHYDAYQKIPSARVIAVADRNPKRAGGDLTGGWGNFGDGGTQHLPMDRITGFTDWRELIARPDVDVVDVCLATPGHVEATLAALAAGKHVLCEKPLALNYPEARALSEAAKRSERIHMVAFTFRFPAALRYLKRLVGEGHFGEIRHWRMSYFNDGQLEPGHPFTWRHQRARGGAGIVADMGSHMVDIARYLVGDIAAVSGVSRTYVTERRLAVGSGTGKVETPDACAFLAEFASGVIGSFDLSRAVAGRGGSGRPQYQAVEIHGTEGAAVYELIHPFQLQVSLGPAMARRQQWATVEVPVDLLVYPGSPRNPRGDDPLLGYKYDQGVAFVRAIRGETTDYPTFRDGAEAQRVVEAVDAATAERRWVTVARD
jgi:predicted dehydrogenase